MKRNRSVFLIFAIILGSTVGLWMYQAWRERPEREIKNVYVVKQKGELVKLYLAEGGKKQYTAKKDISEMEYQGIADVYVRGDEVQRLVCKPEVIQGTVLSVETGAVDIAAYGTLREEAEISWYSVSDVVCVSSRDELYVGQTDARFVVADGKIVSVLFAAKKSEEQVESKMQEIRVILKTDDGDGYDHAEVSFRGTGKLYVKEGEKRQEYAQGEEICITADQMTGDRMELTSEEGGKIELTSVKRAQGIPAYRGKVELVKTPAGIHIINELPLEEYLYGVIPSEMPAEYASEALKAQAVCARNYAVKHIKNHRLRQLGAHVDDSASYQVYNNMPEDERCNQAVDATRGQKMYDGKKVASSYFFSTSCGVTTSAKDVTFTEKDLAYLSGSLQKAEFDAKDTREQAGLVAGMLGDERLFRKFLNQDRDVLDRGQSWYRWQTTIPIRDIEKQINQKIGERSKVAGEKIQVKQADGTYRSEQIESIGKLKRIRIKQRKSGGVVYMAVIVGTEAVVRVYSEYNIRMLFFGENAVITKQDGSHVSGLSMLPSGFFVIDRCGSSYEFMGGGFGHGTGMSQTGANELAGLGKNYVEILSHYFPGTQVR